jgi:hypothetical protein
MSGIARGASAAGERSWISCTHFAHAALLSTWSEVLVSTALLNAHQPLYPMKLAIRSRIVRRATIAVAQPLTDTTQKDLVEPSNLGSFLLDDVVDEAHAFSHTGTLNILWVKIGLLHRLHVKPLMHLVHFFLRIPKCRT